MNISPHINFNGNAEEAFEFYRSVFGGQFSKVVRFKDLSKLGVPVSAEEMEKIMFISLPIGNTELFANDIPQSMGKVSENENRSKICVKVADRLQADEIFLKLTVGGAIEMPMSQSPWKSYFGMFRDKFGIEWMIESPL